MQKPVEKPQQPEPDQKVGSDCAAAQAAARRQARQDPLQGG